MFLPRPEPDRRTQAPGEHAIGNMVVGVVTEAGRETSLYKPGDVVFGNGAIAKVQQSPESEWHP